MSEVSKRDDVVEMYRRTFSTPVGRDCLAHLLERLGYFNILSMEDAEGVALQNFARRLLENLGVSSINHQDHLRFVDSILGIEVTLDGDAAPKEGT